MCTRPVLIKNPNRGLGQIGLNRLKDCTSYYIPVPCGHCKQCMQRRQSDIVQRAMIMAEHYHPFFFTLTYKDDMMPWYDCPDGVHRIRYADMSDVTHMLKRFRLNNTLGRPFKYFLVSELGSRKARPHFHGLIFLEKKEGEGFSDGVSLATSLEQIFISSWQRNCGSRRSPDMRDLCVPRKYYVSGRRHGTYDWQYALFNSMRSADSVAYYVTKYCLKPSKHERSLQRALKLNYSPEVYDEIWRVVKPRAQWSKDFGLRSMEDVQRRLASNVAFSAANGSEFPQFYSPGGKSFPLAKFYKTLDVVPMDMAMLFFQRHCIAHGTTDGYIETPERDPVRTDQEEIDLFNMQDTIENMRNDLDFSGN